MPVVAPAKKTRPTIRHQAEPEGNFAPTFYVVCWNDPVNLMIYVTHVFMKVFGWNREKAQKHMMEVHNQGEVTSLFQAT
jgi:ATP-dependent Clp protease adaptor protein ClpS